MSRVAITTPVDGYSGSVGGVVFAAGRAEVDEDEFPAEVAYCRDRGYTVVELEQPAPKKAAAKAAASKPEETAS